MIWLSSRKSMLSGFQTDKTCTYMYKHSFGDLLPVTCMFDLTWHSSKATVKDVGLTDNYGLLTDGLIIKGEITSRGLYMYQRFLSASVTVIKSPIIILWHIHVIILIYCTTKSQNQISRPCILLVILRTYEYRSISIEIEWLSY